MTDSRVLLVDGIKNIRHLKQTVSTTEINVLEEMFPTGIPDSIFHVRAVVTNDAAARFNVNGCAAATANAMYASQSIPLDVRMYIDSVKCVRDGSTDANCEITVWW